jgi:hypothetical protein
MLSELENQRIHDRFLEEQRAIREKEHEDSIARTAGPLFAFMSRRPDRVGGVSQAESAAATLDDARQRVAESRGQSTEAITELFHATTAVNRERAVIPEITDVNVAMQRIDDGDHSTAAIAALFNATRRVGR